MSHNSPDKALVRELDELLRGQGLRPWLAWFEGGVFEQFFLDFAELEPAAWAGIRPELEATALLRVVDAGIQINNRPFLKLHPTLPDAVRDAPLADPEAARQRFIEVYLQVRQTIHQALLGSQPAADLALGQIAAILKAAGRHREAGARYREALEAAEATGDLDLQPSSCSIWAAWRTIRADRPRRRSVTARPWPRAKTRRPPPACRSPWRSWPRPCWRPCPKRRLGGAKRYPAIP